MTAAEKREANRRKASAFRDRQRAKGFKLVQYWVPDTGSKEFLEEAERQSQLIAQSPHAEEDQAWVDSVSWLSTADDETR